MPEITLGELIVWLDDKIKGSRWEEKRGWKMSSYERMVMEANCDVEVARLYAVRDLVLGAQESLARKIQDAGNYADTGGDLCGFIHSFGEEGNE